MTLLWFILGIFLPTINGWLIIRILEGKSSVLFRLERWVLGFLLGLTFTMFVTFLVHVTTSLPLSRFGFLAIQLSLAIILEILSRKLKSNPTSRIYNQQTLSYLPKWLRAVIILLAVWTAIKILSTGITFALLTPPFLDDTVDNWNLRGKMFFMEQRLQLEIPDNEGNLLPHELSSYPPAVPLAKAQLATLAGHWSEPLVNSINLLWFLSALALLFFAIRRSTNSFWAFLGVYALVSLPLYLMHGTNTYSDVFLSAHIFAAISMLYFAMTTNNSAQRMSFFRLGAFATALLPFTKNEALLMYLPAIVLILIVALILKKQKGELPLGEAVKAFLWYVICIAVISVPWITFKWAHGLTFGNAKALSGLKIAWQSGVLKSVAINTFLEGNWLLLFPLLVFLLIAKKTIAFKTPLVVLTGFFLIMYFGQLLLYMFTYLSAEALYQTGYARGLVQLAPVVVMIVTMLLSSCFQQAALLPESTEEKQAKQEK